MKYLGNFMQNLRLLDRLTRLAEKQAEVSETKLQPYGSWHFECLGIVSGVLNMGCSLFCWGERKPVS